MTYLGQKHYLHLRQVEMDIFYSSIAIKQLILIELGNK